MLAFDKARNLIVARGATTAEKLRGTKVWVPTAPGALAPRARPKAGLGVGCERGSPPPL